MHFCLDRWVSEGRFSWLRHTLVALPSLVLQLDVLDSDSIRIGIEVRERLPFRDPAVEHTISNSQLTSFVVNLDSDGLAKVFERDFEAQPCLKVPYLICPLFELGIVSHSTLQHDRIIFSAPW